MGVARWTYNNCLSGIINKNIPKTKKELRKYCINSDCALKDNKFIFDVPYDVRNEAMCDLLKAYKTCFASKHRFQIKYKSKKDKKDSIVLHSKHYKHKKGDYSFIQKLKSSEPLPDKLDYDSRIIKDSLNQYWICIPILFSQQRILDNQESSTKEKVIAIDPGVRTFATMYDSNGNIIECGKGDIGRIYRLGCVVDKLQSKWTKVNHRKRYKLKKVAMRIRYKIQNLVKDLHCKLVKYLCENYEFILIPTFDTQNMVDKRKRKINSKIARQIITWSHYKFRERLLNKAREYPWVKVKIITEEYTSQICGNCGNLNKELGSKKEFICPTCKYVADRDFNAARNIMIKSLSETKESL